MMKKLTDKEAVYFAETLRNLLEQGYLDDMIKQITKKDKNLIAERRFE